MTPDVIVIRWAQEEDVPSVWAIEHASFASPRPHQEIRRSLSSARTRSIVACVETPEPPRPWKRFRGGGSRTVVGHCSYRRSGGDGFEIERLAVSPAWRRRGVGRALAAAVQEKARPHRPSASIRVPEEALEAQLWLRAVGWRCVRVDGGFYVFAWTLSGVRSGSARSDRPGGEVGGCE